MIIYYEDYFTVIIAKRKLQIVLKKNSRRNAQSHSYIICADYKKKRLLSIKYELREI